MCKEKLSLAKLRVIDSLALALLLATSREEGLLTVHFNSF